MRVLVINTVPTGKNGMTNVIFNLYGAMDRRDITVDYVAVNEPDPEYVRQINAGGGQVFILRRTFPNVVGYYVGLRRLIRRGKYDIVHAHGNSATLALEMRAARSAGCPVRIAHSHNTTCRYRLLHKMLTPAFGRDCTHRLACGTDAGKWLYGKADFTVLHNGVDTERFAFDPRTRARIREQFGIRDGDVVIGHVGAFVAAKNQSFLADVFDALAENEESYRLMFVGDGPLRHAVERKMAELHPEDKVIFVGNTDWVEEYLSACDLIVMPSLFEGLPLTLIEEQANGLSCIVSDNITREADKTGKLVFLPLSCGAAKWAETVRQVSAKQHRTEEDARIAAETVARCGYDIRTNAQELKRYYERALAEQGSAETLRNTKNRKRT